ncbi:cardiolipin synthase (plasmid) [Clostridium perfringens]
MFLILILIIILDIITALELIFKYRRSIQSTISWVLLLVLFPIGGFVLYNLFGRGLKKSRKFKLKKEEDIAFRDNFLKNEFDLYSYQQDTVDILKKHSDMIRMFCNTDNVAFTDGNKVDIYTESNEFFSALLESIENAKYSINIQFYIFKSDSIGTQIINLLEKKQKEGVRVKILYDAIGSRTLKYKVFNKLVALGGQVEAFLPHKLKKLRFNINYRNHRKLVIIDDSIGFIGGFNIGDEYLGRCAKFGLWRDTHLKIEGPATTYMNLRFMMDWRFASNEDIDLTSYLYKPTKKVGSVSVQIVSSGPDTDLEEIKYGYIKMMQSAKKYIYIQSPYFILDETLLNTLKLAIFQGIDVRIMLPSKPDHPFVYWASWSYAGELLNLGAKVYLYSEKAFLHAKTVVIDDEVCSIGTANMDIRSFSLNFEVNAFVYSQELSKLQRELFESDILNSVELTKEVYKSRNLTIRFKESISRLLSPIL